METAVFRIVQEAVNNAIQHGAAHAIVIVIVVTISDQQLLLKIRDDGVGFAPEMKSTKNRRGMGMTNMRERVELLGGQFALTSWLGGGTVIEVSIPLPGEFDLNEIKVLLADDHTLVRAGLRSLINGFEGFCVIAETGDGREAVRLTRQLQPDIALLDISMPGLNGLDATALIARETPNVRVVILSMHTAETYVLEALQGRSGRLCGQGCGGG